MKVPTWPGWNELTGGAGIAGLSIEKPMPPWSWLPSGFAPGNDGAPLSCKKQSQSPTAQHIACFSASCLLASVRIECGYRCTHTTLAEAVTCLGLIGLKQREHPIS